MSTRPTVEILHTSDLHVGLDYGFPEGRGPMQALTDLATLARARRPAAVVIAGDFFDHNRLPAGVVLEAFGLLAETAAPVVILPGNHDPAGPDSLYARHPLPGNVRVIASAEGELVQLDGVTLWGQAHTSYHDFRPLGGSPSWPDASAWRVAVAHGHFAESDYDRRFSYCIESHELEATAADYVALGHWDVHQPVGRGRPPVYYSGSPCRTGRFALVSLAEGGVEVTEIAVER